MSRPQSAADGLEKAHWRLKIDGLPWRLTNVLATDDCACAGNTAARPAAPFLSSLSSLLRRAVQPVLRRTTCSAAREGRHHRRCAGDSPRAARDLLGSTRVEKIPSLQAARIGNRECAACSAPTACTPQAVIDGRAQRRQRRGDGLRRAHSRSQLHAAMTVEARWARRIGSSPPSS